MAKQTLHIKDESILNVNILDQFGKDNFVLFYF